ncbi:hypothetical protein ACFORK_14340 [Paenibacillus sp. GCM10012306]
MDSYLQQGLGRPPAVQLSTSYMRSSAGSCRSGGHAHQQLVPSAGVAPYPLHLYTCPWIMDTHMMSCEVCAERWTGQSPARMPTDTHNGLCELAALGST